MEANRSGIGRLSRARVYNDSSGLGTPMAIVLLWKLEMFTLEVSRHRAVSARDGRLVSLGLSFE
jgi:hypothetical protein